MFLKPFRVKSNSLLKNSERKALKTRILQKFPTLAENDVNQEISNKDPVSVAKLLSHLNNYVTVYTVKKRPLFFELDDILYPTVYFLWSFPDLIRCFTTHPPVLTNLCAGADLMLPGVVLPNIEGPSKYGRFEKGTMVAVNTTDNKAPIAVGVTMHSNMDMYMTGGRGKCVNILHTVCDHLCRMDGTTPLPIPELGLPDWLKPEDVQEFLSEAISVLIPAIATLIPNDSDQNSEASSVTELTDELDASSLISTMEEMDQLLTYCFLKTLKYSGKKITLPVLTSNFYRLHILNACPAGKNLDIKKTSYKKLNKFLNAMKSEGILHVVEQAKGVETVSAINFEHPRVTSFRRAVDDVNENIGGSNGKPSVLEVQEAYTVTAHVLPIFADAGKRKGDSVQPADVRKIVADYVKKKKLNSFDNRVTPNKELVNILQTENNHTWEELMQKIFKAMSSSYKIKLAGTQLSSGKGKVEPIILTIGSRSGNKKVTLVDNLELFGIRAADFGKECQHGVAASTSVTKPVGKKCEQLLIQGNQVAFVGNLLTTKYEIPKRFIRGLELAIKNKH